MLITPAEVEHAQANPTLVALCIVSDIRVTRDGSDWSAAGGESRWIRSWDIEAHGTLRALGWAYRPHPG